MLDWKKYSLVFLITLFIFGTTLYASSYFNNRRVNDIRATEDKISTDILSLETQFDLLEQISCEDIAQNPILTPELPELASRLNYTEEELGTGNEQVIGLKKIYSLLLIKDFILKNRIAKECRTEPVSIIYFYSNKGDCADCRKQGYVLTDLQQKYPALRIYAFDYNLDLSAIRTLQSIYNVKNELPALVIKNKEYYGYKDEYAIQTIIPELPTLAPTTSSATSSSKKK